MAGRPKILGEGGNENLYPPLTLAISATLYPGGGTISTWHHRIEANFGKDRGELLLHQLGGEDGAMVSGGEEALEVAVLSNHRPRHFPTREQRRDVRTQQLQVETLATSP